MRKLLTLAVLLPTLVAAGCSADSDEDAAPAGSSTTLPRAAPPRTVTVPARTSPAERGPSGNSGSFDRIPQIVDDVESSVVAIVVPGQGEGSGVIWNRQGAIVTNDHVVGDAESVQVVLSNGERLQGSVRGSDSRSDLAVLQVTRRNLRPATFARELPDVGELAVAIGNPSGFENTVSAGIVSGLHRAIPSGGQTPALVDLVQTDAAISPGNSGGALVGSRSEVIGINVAYLPPQTSGAVSIGFAIPAPTVIDVVTQLLRGGRVQQAYLGITYPAIPVDSAEGALVDTVAAGSAAQEAGFRPGDLIVAFAGRPVRAVEDLLTALRRQDPGDRIRIVVERGSRRQTLTATLDERPPDTG